jgi:uncharacterized protein (DUF302 family)
MTTPTYAYRKTLNDTTFEEARQRVESALSEQGFGILTEIDVKETFRKKLDVDFKKYQILGACNPDLAYEALQNEEWIGLLLPCNVVVAEGEDGAAEVGLLKPAQMFEVVENDGLSSVADEADTRIQKALESL